jgi:hypothetical protein
MVFHARFFTYRHDGLLVKEPLELWSHYKRSGFQLDLLMVLPFDLVFFGWGTVGCYVVRLLKLLRAVRYVKYAKGLELLLKRNLHIKVEAMIWKIFLTILLFILACNLLVSSFMVCAALERTPHHAGALVAAAANSTLWGSSSTGLSENVTVLLDDLSHHVSNDWFHESWTMMTEAPVCRFTLLLPLLCPHSFLLCFFFSSTSYLFLSLPFSSSLIFRKPRLIPLGIGKICFIDDFIPSDIDLS